MHSDNYIPANPMQTPPSIVPEWYLLPFYAILRSIPNKLLGVIAMFASLLILLGMPIFDTSRIRGSEFRPLFRVAFWILVGTFVVLMYVGSQHVEAPYIMIGQIATTLYFTWFIFIIPIIGIIENTLLDISFNVTENIKINNISASKGRIEKSIFSYFKKFFFRNRYLRAAFEGFTAVSLSPTLMRYSQHPIAIIIKISGPLSFLILRDMGYYNRTILNTFIFERPIIVLFLSFLYFIFVCYIFITVSNRIFNAIYFIYSGKSIVKNSPIN